MLSVKQGSIKYHFLSLWYDSTLDWTQVSRAIGEQSNHYANKLNDCAIDIYSHRALHTHTHTYICVSVCVCVCKVGQKNYSPLSALWYNCVRYNKHLKKRKEINVGWAIFFAILLYDTASWVIYRQHLRLHGRFRQHYLCTIYNIHSIDFVTKCKWISS